MGKTARLLPLVLTAAALVPAPHAPAATAAPPETGEIPSYQEIPLDGPSVQAHTKPYGMVGVTWPEGAEGVVAKVRVERGGKWTGWQDLHVEDGHGPDPLVSEGIQRGGTEPLWVGDATGVEASAVTTAGTMVEGAKVVLIQPGVLATDAEDDPAAQSSEPRSQEIGPEASRAPYPMPLMVSRRRWGADERLRAHNGADCVRPKYTTTVQAAFVHHTADRNDYTRTQVAAMMRAIYAYHVKSRGWCDVGYNFLIDRFGRIFEGRAGGAQWPVLGAHTASFNADSFGVALIGNFDKAAPPPVMLESTARLIAWKLDANYRSPLATIVLDGSRLHTVSGHRDTKATDCPGTQLYNKLGWLKQRVNTLMSGSFSTPIYQYARRIGFRTVGQPFWGEHPTRTGWATYFAARDVFHSVATGPHSTEGAFRTRYRRLGAGSARLGLPITDAYRVPGGSRQKFQRGWLVWDRGSRQVSLVYGRAS
ncbi:peptidoglycan recognition protein [Kribbella solani]|uniref:peptidoglycan recognition protein n=1 Tax=Kribbella solani TaxID=236067 RepID=UPI0029BC6B33|nr:peptidoglycan recognition protein [Kribbella solani]MDX2972695.1 peptidoglycan recognition protein [Kribbella solani]